MGYAVPGQRGTGIHLRLKARAFAFEDENGKRFVFASLDGGMGSDIINQRVVEKLATELGEGVYTLVRFSSLRPYYNRWPLITLLPAG
jgi:hypothetical protein